MARTFLSGVEQGTVVDVGDFADVTSEDVRVYLAGIVSRSLRPCSCLARICELESKAMFPWPFLDQRV
jgi:hypothetical protein